MSAAVQFGSVKQEQIIALREIDEEPTQSLATRGEAAASSKYYGISSPSSTVVHYDRTAPTARFACVSRGYRGSPGSDTVDTADS